MAAGISSLIGTVNGADVNDSASAGTSAALVTRDLLGGCSLDTKELDLDLQVPCGWEKCLDLKSGKVYLQRCNSVTSKSQDPEFHPSTRRSFELLDDASLDLKLVPSSSSSWASTSYQSVCTLDKVKSALERAEKDTCRKRSISMSKSPSPASNSSSSIRDSDYDQAERSPSASYAAGCPSCLLYVLIARQNPICPRCNSVVASPLDSKKPRLDLNMSV